MMSLLIAHCLDKNDRTKDVIENGNITFDSLMLNDIVLSGLRNSGFRIPSPIQSKAIPVGRCGFDIIVNSKSGTGKTLVFSIIALETINLEKHQPQVLIVAPTREIAVQIQEVLIIIGGYCKGLKVEIFIGGLPLEADKEKCKNCHIAVGTPGRIKHLICDGILKSCSIRLFVLDEVDKLMESSFISDINEIFNSLPDRKQIITTSATYPEELHTFLYKYMLSPTYIEIESDTPLLLGLKQFVKIIKPHTSVIQEVKFKNEEILNLLSTISFTQCLVFTNYQTRAESISNFLNQKGWSTRYISAAQSQIQRLEVMKTLKNFECKILLSTDLTARGIDVAKVDLVINYDIPTDAITYLHRMGRAGRYGSAGVCIDFVSSGAAFNQWQNMLGLIGGCSLGVPKLPVFNGSVADLLKVNIPTEQCFFGTISSTLPRNFNKSIKNNILDLKQRKNTLVKEGTKVSSVDKCMTGVLENDIKIKCMPVLDTTKKLAPQAIHFENDLNNVGNKQKENVTNLNELSKISSIESKNQMSNTYKTDISNRPIELEENDVYYKNKALLYVTKILSNNSDDLQESDISALDYYLKIIKKCEKNEVHEVMLHTKFKEVEELVKNMEKFDNANEAENNIENIFQAGYHYVTKSNSNHWSLYLPSSELSRFQNLCLVEKKCSHEVDSVESIYEVFETNAYNECADVLMASQQFKNDNNKGESNSECTQGTSIEKSEKYRLKSESSDWNHFSFYFNQCSENLWQTGLCFQNIEDFDNWFFHKWQNQLFSIRDYIQQKIYVQAMSSYQRSSCKDN